MSRTCRLESVQCSSSSNSGNIVHHCLDKSGVSVSMPCSIRLHQNACYHTVRTIIIGPLIGIIGAWSNQKFENR